MSKFSSIHILQNGRRLLDVIQWHMARPGKLIGKVKHGLLTALLECLTVLLEYLDLLQARWQSTVGIWEGLGPARPAFGYAIDVNDITTQ